jgi:hypothetical protein
MTKLFTTLRYPLWLALAAILVQTIAPPVGTISAEPASDALTNEYAREIRPLMQKQCGQCHSGKRVEAEVDFDDYKSLADVRKSLKTWQKVLEMLDSGQMPPKDAKLQPTDDERTKLKLWVRGYLKFEAKALAGDPGPVVLRRLNNAEYTYTIADLTGVDLKPAREFPADSAAGEGFTNTGDSLVMSPALLTKYLDAGKEISKHAVFLPDGIRFSPSASRRDWTNELLDQIRTLYREYSDSQGGTRVNLQGIVFDTNDGGRLPLERFLAAMLAEREAIKGGTKTIDAVATERKLSPKYLGLLWTMLNGNEPSPLFDQIRNRWKTAKPGDEKAIAAEVNVWQNALTRFQNVGHMKKWMLPTSPIVSKQEVRLKVSAAAKGNEVSLYLLTGDAGDGNANDFVVWQNPRFVILGRPDLSLRDVREFVGQITLRREQLFGATAKCLVAAAEANEKPGKIDVAELAKRHGVETEDLSAWLDFLGIGSSNTPKLDLFTKKMPKSGAYDFVQGWGSPETPLLVANSSEKHVRIPGNMKGHGVCVHPSPTLNACVGWRSPVTGEVRVEAKITHAHPECGNGIEWFLELRRGATRQRLATGFAQGSKEVKVGPIEKLTVQEGDLVSILIGPRDGNHACDLTDVEFTLTTLGDKPREWSLTKDVSPDVLAANPHADRLGNKDVWHFYSEPVKLTAGGQVVPAGSTLSNWLAEKRGDEKKKLAESVQKLLVGGSPADPKHPDAVLYRQLASLGGPLFKNFRGAKGDNVAFRSAKGFGVDPAAFGKHPDGSATEPSSLCVQAPSIVEVKLPADLFAGAEFVATGILDSRTGRDGSVQVQVGAAKPQSGSGLRSDLSVIVADGSEARKRWEQAFEQFRQLFPAALCYTKIVPVDEVITLTLFHREDENLCRLMLSDKEIARLNRLWEELHFISRDAFTIVDAYKQLLEYASQDADPRVFYPLRKPINDRADAYRKELLDAEPKQLDAVIKFAGQAYRRPLIGAEDQELRGLYAKLRKLEMPHDEALRLTLARVFVSPAFLYRLEKSPAGDKPGPVSNSELATRLSYFLTSSMPDEQLLAAAGKLHDPEVLVAQANRLLKSPYARRLATEFACHWLHVSDFDKLDEKSEKHFPDFVKLRGDMFEESVRFFTDFFQSDASILSILDADHTFVNESLAKFYGIPGVTGPEWRRVDGVRKFGRGGILGLATTLAKQSGASRTSPILRGVWISETILGEKLPKPPKDVPRLPEDEADSGKTVRQLVEKHSSDARCAVCHQKIDPYGFALEGYDAIGRKRIKDLGDRPIETQAKLKDGTEFDGLDGLRNYLLTKRRDTFVQQFCRKLLGYALGRGVQLSDEPLLDEMQAKLEKNGYRVSVAIEAIVRSPQFREIRGREFVEAK